MPDTASIRPQVYDSITETIGGTPPGQLTKRQRRRLDFLFATDLRNHEIILGKLASRLASVALLLVTGLPVLALMQLLGGVEPNFLLACFGATLATMVTSLRFSVARLA